MNGKRLLIYCDEYPPAPSGGIGSVTKLVAEGLVERGWNVVVAGSYEYGTFLPPLSNSNGVEIYRFEYFGFLRLIPGRLRRIVKALLRRTGVLSALAAKALIRNERKMDQLLQQLDIDVLELVDYVALLREITQPVPLQRFSVPSTLRVHGSVSFLNLNNGISQEAQLLNDQRNFSRADHISAVSEYSKTFINGRLLKSPRDIEVLHNPIEDKMMETPPSKGSKTILFYGKIVHTKGAFQVLKAFQAIAAEFGDWKLLLVGGGDIASAQRMVELCFKDRIAFTGYVDRTQVIRAIDEAAFVVVPSYFENFSMVPLEVMARQTAIIYTARTSGKEIITDGVDGLLVDPDDLDALQEKMTCLMKDEHRRNELARAGLNTVKKRFALSVILDQLEHHYHSVIEGQDDQKSMCDELEDASRMSHSFTSESHT